MQVSALRKTLARCAVLPAVFVAIMIGSTSAVADAIRPQLGATYKIVRPIYLMAVYESMDEKLAGRGAVRAYLQPERYAKTRWVAFQCKVPAGTVMTIIRPAPSAKDLWNRYDAYYVQLDPDPSRQLDVIVQLFRGFGDASGGLSAEFFERVNPPIGTAPAVTADCAERK
jgi:hypothetical protein